MTAPKADSEAVNAFALFFPVENSDWPPILE